MKEVLRVYWFLLFLFLVTSLAHGQVRRDSASRIRFGTAVPATCNPSIGSVFFLITPGTPLGMHQCLATDTWTPLVGSMSGTGSADQVAFFTAPTDLGGDARFRFDGGDVLIGSPTTISFEPDGTAAILNLNMNSDASVIAFGTNQDVQLHWDAADILAQRRTTNEQRFNIYKTFTDSSNYERLSLYTGGGPNPLVEISAETAGTGADNIDINIESAGTAGQIILTRDSDIIIFQSNALNFTPAFDISLFNINNLTAGGILSIGNNSTGGDGFTMNGLNLSGVGTQDSSNFLMIGKSFDVSNHNHRWRRSVEVDTVSSNTFQLSAGIDGFSSLTNVFTLSNSQSGAGGGIVAGFPEDVASIQLGAALDAQIHRGDAADTWEQRRGLNPQQWRLYDRFVSHADYDRLNVYIGGGPAVKTIEIEADSSSATQGINIVMEALANAFGDGSITLRAGTSGATLFLAPAGAGDFSTLTSSQFSTTGNVIFNGDMRVTGAGPHSIGGTTSNSIQLLMGETFTSNGSSDIASGIFHTPTIIGFTGDTVALTGATFTAAITTQTATETIANIAQLQINEPAITDNLTGNITQASTVLITGAPTEGVRNYALNVEDGSVRFALAGPHVMGGVPQGLFQFAMVGSFTSGGSGIQAANLRVAPNLGGAPGDTLRLAGTDLASIIVTQTATESIADVAQLYLVEPNITDNLTGSITRASTVNISGHPTEGVDNFALIAAGPVEITDTDTRALLVSGGGFGAEIFFVDTNNDEVRLPTGSLFALSGSIGAAGFTVTSQIQWSDANAPRINNVAATADAANIFPNRADVTTGIGGVSGQVSLIVVNAEILTALAGAARLSTGTDLTWETDGNGNIGATDSTLRPGTIRAATDFAVGPTPSLNGAIRITNGAGIRWRNGANNNNVFAISVDGSDIMQLGEFNMSGLEITPNIGFYGTTPVAQAAAYTRNATIVEDRTLLASASATALNNNNVLAALIADLQAYGLLQ